MTDDMPGDRRSTDDAVHADAQITDDDLAFAAADAGFEVIGHAEALEAVQRAFAGLAGSQEVDILPAEGEGRNDIAVAGDAWTLYLSGWPGPVTAFVAVEDEPDEDADAGTVEAVWRAVVSGDAIAAMVMADMDLEGALSTALDASGDPLSQSITAAVRAGAANP